MRNRTQRLSIYFGVAAAMALLALGPTARRADASFAGVTIDPQGTLLAGGSSVELRGLVQATPGEHVTISLSIQQAKGNKSVTATGATNFDVTGGVQAWALTATAPFGETFASGPALVYVTAIASGEFTGVSRVIFSAKVKLGK